jgi:hypothetical protein
MLIESVSKLFATKTINPGADEFTLLAIIVALSAYLATVRHFLLERIAASDEGESGRTTVEPQGRKRIKKRLLVLVIGDAPITAAAVLVGLHSLYSSPPQWFLRVGIRCFTIGGLFLLVMHIASWLETVSSLRSGRESAAPAADGQTESRSLESQIVCNGKPMHVKLSLIVPAESESGATSASPGRQAT